MADADPTVRRLSIEGLREDDDESLIPLFVQALQTDPDAEVRAAAAKALGQFVLLGEYEEIAVANAGGVINVYSELAGWTAQRALRWTVTRMSSAWRPSMPPANSRFRPLPRVSSSCWTTLTLPCAAQP